jgi:hypothetical protein
LTGITSDTAHPPSSEVTLTLLDDDAVSPDADPLPRTEIVLPVIAVTEDGSFSVVAR